MLFSANTNEAEPLMSNVRPHSQLNPSSLDRKGHFMASSPSIQQIASAALQFWDMNAEEAESEDALKVAVAQDAA